MAETQGFLDKKQDLAKPTLLAVPEVRGTRFHPGYLAPLAVHRFTGALDLVSAEGAPGLLFVGQGTLTSGTDGRTVIGPGVVSVREPWGSSPGSEGWLAVFHPSVVNQEMAGWPCNPDTGHQNPYLDQDREMLGAVLTPEGRESFLLAPDEAQYLERLFSSMADLLGAQADVYWPCRSRSLLLEILYFLWRRPGPVLLGAAGSRSQAVQDWLRVHYAEKTTVSALASRFGTNRTTLQEQFQARYGVSVMDFLGEVRIAMACVQVRNTALSLAEVADRVGFSDYSSFYREFLRRRSVTPQVYRKTLAPVRIY